MPKSVTDLNKRLRDHRNSLGLVEVRLWVPKAVKAELMDKYPSPKIHESTTTTGN